MMNKSNAIIKIAQKNDSDELYSFRKFQANRIQNFKVINRLVVS
jgi:hypothetical protein